MLVHYYSKAVPPVTLCASDNSTFFFGLWLSVFEELTNTKGS